MQVGASSRTQKHSEAGYGRPVDRGAWTAKTVKQPRQHARVCNWFFIIFQVRFQSHQISS